MADIGGLVLGVLPLVIEVAKRYKAIYRVFARYKNCGDEVIEFQRRLYVEQTTFCNEVQILLACLSGLETASRMIEEKNHHLASDTNAQMKLLKHLGDSETACLGIITAIGSKLSLMDQFLEKSVPHESKRDLFIRTKKKLRFAFAETQLEVRLSELAKLNSEFVRISSQIHRLQNVQTGPTSAQKPRKTRYNAEQYNTVRKVAVELFDALGEACSVHPEHCAQIQVEVQHVNLSASDPPFIRFIMAFAQSVLENPSAGTGPIWIAIESILNDTVANKAIKQRDEVQNAFSNFKMTLEHIIDPPQPPQVTATEGGDSEERAVPPPQTLSNEALISNVADTSLPDFSKNHNFCVHVQQSQPHSTTDGGTCLGYLRRGDTCKHRVSLVPDALVSQTKESISLARLMTLVAQKRHTEQLLQYESLRLARQLASAVLQFHATPLLKDCWRSDDVVFFGMSEKTLQKRLTLTAPHLNVQVRDQGPLGSQINSSDVRVFRNPYLFGLGVVLIELAYQAPFRSLREEEDCLGGQGDLYTDLRTAERLSDNIGNGLGSTYGQVVRRCLSCNFGEDSKDLRDPRLQAAFHSDVLGELERLEERVRKFQIGD